MTENEAIAEITSWTRILMRPENQYTSETAEAQDMAIKALEEIQQYQSIGTVAECREAMGRHAKYQTGAAVCEPEYLGENVSIGYRNGRCRCGNIVRSYQKFCDECGIKLDWGNTHKE